LSIFLLLLVILNRDPSYILFIIFVFIQYYVLQTCETIIRFRFFLQENMVQIENIIPKQMVFGHVMSWKKYSLFLKSLKSNSTYETIVFLIFLNTCFSISQLAKSIDHDTWNNISKKHSHKDIVKNIKNKPGCLESWNIVSNLLTYIQRNNTLGYWLTMLYWNIIWIHRLNIRVKTEDWEYYYKW
jgi:hypothetical protein